MLVLKGLVGLHKTVQLQLLQHYWLGHRLGLRAMLSKSLIQFAVDGWGCVPSLLLDLRPNYDGGNEDNGNLLQKGPGTTATLSAPDPEAGHCRPTPPLETPGHSWAFWASLLWHHCSFLLGPGVHKVLCMPSKSQSCVSSVVRWWG